MEKIDFYRQVVREMTSCDMAHVYDLFAECLEKGNVSRAHFLLRILNTPGLDFGLGLVVLTASSHREFDCWEREAFHRDLRDRMIREMGEEEADLNLKGLERAW